MDLKLTNLMPPENTGTTDITARIVYSALSTYSYNQYSGDIDYVVNPSANLVVTPKAETGVTTVEVI